MTLQKQILVVEDNELNRDILKEILSEKYKVLEAANGQEAFDILLRHRDDIALILLDVMMPVMDGYTFLDLIKREPDLALIPVIVTTQSETEDDEIVALSHGATDFVPKPYRPQVILHRVASIIKLRETAAIVNQFQYDRLTGLYSKEFFYQKVKERLETYTDQEYTIVCSNIENFKLYNDTFGVKAGDQLLQEIAHQFREKAGEKAICGRFGSDRFLCLQEKSKERKERVIIENMDIPKVKNVTMKWGIYEITDKTVSVEQMCDRALLAADSVKGHYNCHFAVYDDVLRGKLLREKAITDSMETALSEGQFIVYFQPKYSLNDNDMAGAEALVRWIHPQWGFLSPGEFIPLFEKNGFITQLDQYIWEQVCVKLRDWKQKGYSLLPISVNVSRADIYQADLPDVLSNMIEQYGIDPSWLHLEITESAYADNPSQILSAVDQLRHIGFIVEMDDFGSGYSSLNMLNQMKLDILKLDMQFIQNEMSKPVDESILRFIINLAHWMNLGVVAEGVETKEQLDRLRGLGCDYVQGYFLAKPMPDLEFEQLLKTRTSKKKDSVQKSFRKKKRIRRLLVVDEDILYREKVRKTFQGQYELLEAQDANTALSYIAEYGENVACAVILSMTLPEDGANCVLKGLRQNPMFWQIPVLATIPRGEVVEELSLTLDTDDFLCKCHPQWDLRRRVERLIGIMAGHERENALLDEASRDYITGLLNRRGLQDAIDSLRKEDLPLALYLFDLDDLKKVNDTKGHEVGDQMICSFADVLRHQTRAGDILCRYGGDEFLVMLKHIDNKEIILRKGLDICRIFQEYLVENHLQGACSGGVVLCHEDERISARLIECADQALYYAKKEKKGTCILWDQDCMSQKDQ